MFMTAEQMNRQLFGYTNIVELRLLSSQNHAFNLVVVLANFEDQSITLTCENISQFNLQTFTGQFLMLQVFDIRDRQLDRANFIFRGIERDDVSFTCERADISQNS
jgi:hypothetical protein